MKEILDKKPEFETAKITIQNFLDADNSLIKILNSQIQIKENVLKAIKEHINNQVETLLGNIEIDEINRGELSVRVSSLKKAGYTNYFKIYKILNASKLAKINGISEDVAYKIKSIVYDAEKKIRESVVPRISIDNKTKQTENLLKALFVCIKVQPHIEKARELYNNYHKKIQSLTQEIEILTSKLKWFFSSKNSKVEAINSFLKLKSYESENFFVEVGFIVDSITYINNTKTSEIWADFKENSAYYYAVLEQLQGIDFSEIANKNGLSLSLVESIKALEPNLEGLNCTLRSYQEFGTKYILHQGYALLGDEMGLGKTVQAIASMVAIRNFGENRFLVVCPASVLINWCREIERFSDLKVFKLHGDNRDETLQDWIKFGGVGVTTYETLDKLDLSNVFNISLLIADEAHYVKNPKANRTINLISACDKSERVLFMTGTALENKVDEMCFLISCLDKNLAHEIKDMKHLVSAPLFREKVAPVYLRRTREDVLQELPELTITDEWCEMSEVEKQNYYSSTMSENFMAMRQVSWDVADINNSSKATRLKEIYEQAKEDKRKVIIFSYFLNTINQVKKLLGTVCFGPINGSVLPQDRQKIIDEFSKAEDGAVLLAQIQAGGTGVNIQAASCVIICEPQLKPSTENQAISRTYRMGQTRNVLVYKLMCEQSVDERIAEILENKETVFEHFADISHMGKQSIEIDAKLSKNIVKEEIERLKNQSK